MIRAEMYEIGKPNIVNLKSREIKEEQADHAENDQVYRMAVNRMLCIRLAKSDLLLIL